MLSKRSYIQHINCLECEHQFPFVIGIYQCPACGGVWLDAVYDYSTVAQVWQTGLTGRFEQSLWRYQELLPILEPDEKTSMGEGQTPLTRAKKLQRRLGHPNLFIKDERQSPTSSFKDRQAAVAVTAMKEAGITECVLASTGNAAAAYAAYCARADIKLWIFLTSLVPAAKMREAALYGAEVVKVAGTYDQAKKVAADFAARRGIHFDKGAKSIPGKESMKSIAYEIAEQLPHLLNEPTPWRAPDWFLQAVSGGIGPLGVLKGFEELYRMGLIDRVPKIGILQVDGCSPMARSFAAGQPKVTPMIPETRITVLSTGNPGLSYEILYQANQKYGGHMLAVSDEAAFDAMRLLAKTEGYSVEPATAVAFAGLQQLIQREIIGQDEVVVVNCSGHTFPVEKHIMDEENVLDVRLGDARQAAQGRPLDGLGEALNRLDEQVTTIVVIDDNPMDSRLVRRLLQARKPYRVFEANNAREGLELVRERLPDLVVSDLEMPEIDGFTLLEELKKDAITSRIPVIVISGKDLTPDDKRRLEGQTSSIWLKGSFSTKALVEHVVSTLSSPSSNEETPSAVVPHPKPATLNNGDRIVSDDTQIKRLVLVDDNPTEARLISRILQTNSPLDVTHVQIGTQAIAVIRNIKPHIIILDLMMPDISGFDILAQLRADRELDTIPVVVVTARHLSYAERQFLTDNGVLATWQKGRLDRKKLVADIEAKLLL